jgi:hypothetical protein
MDFTELCGERFLLWFCFDSCESALILRWLYVGLIFIYCKLVEPHLLDGISDCKIDMISNELYVRDTCRLQSRFKFNSNISFLG